ncbi:hypothetical protein EYD46_09805 [Hyunsoonleella pacifica]|uniref:Toxin-antitoxin system YwqK family antitoxin n=1 Tax=Hyunsoonleella pacifica TaxID=1080224 RepID=A0A4Q9FN94_9FLAO|nr:hypothetical protein EYD46_09805 [Hyunsoonleella pacifica]
MNYTLINTILFFQEIIKALQVASTRFCLCFILCCVFGCAKHKNSTRTVANIEVNKQEVILKPNLGRWFHENELFNGYAVSFHTNGNIAERIGYIDGAKQGKAQKWFANGKLQKESNYNENRLDDTMKVWWDNGVLASESQFVNGLKQGEQKRWFSTGQIARKTHYNKGQEEGLQQAWLKNGEIYINYEAKNGRTFGLRKAKLCYELEDEKINM